MKLKEVKNITDIKKGDTIILTGKEFKNEPLKVQMVKVSEGDGTEIILNKKKNTFFNLGMYLKGNSRVEEVKLVI